MYEASVTSHFSAAHRLRDYAGDCARLHGHNWEVTVVLRTASLDDQGISMDFRLIKQSMKAVLGEFDHTEINQHPDFQELNPTSENLARYLFKRLGRELTDERVHITRVEVAESPNSRAAYFE